MNNSDVIQFGDLLRQLARYKWLLILTVISSTLLGLLLSFLVTKKYEAEALLMPAIQNHGVSQLPSDLLSLGSFAGLNLGGSSTEKAEALAILESRQFARGFITDNELMPTLFRKSWDEVAKSWQDNKMPTIYDAVTRFRDTVYTVRRVPNSDMVRLSVIWTDPSVAFEWASAMVSRLNSSLRTRAIEKANRNISFLEAELDKTSNVELRQAIYRLIEEQIHSKMLANVQEEYAFVMIDPPVVADLDDYVAPNRAVFVLGGGVIGLLIGVLLLVVLSTRQSRER